MTAKNLSTSTQFPADQEKDLTKQNRFSSFYWKIKRAVSRGDISGKRLETEYEKFLAEFHALEIRLEPRLAEDKPDTRKFDRKDMEYHLAAIGELSALCKNALSNVEYTKGWQHLKAANRHLLHVYQFLDDTDLLSSRATAAKNEAASKLGASWRAKTIEQLIKDPQDIQIDQLVEAVACLDAAHDNNYFKIAIIRKRLKILTIAGLAAIALWILLAPELAPYAPAVDPASETSATQVDIRFWRNFWLTLMTVGLMGAIVSGFTASGPRSKSKKIPDQLLGTTLILSRLALGTVTAVVASLLLASSLLNLGDFANSFELLLGVAFIAGFSERLVVRVVEANINSGSAKPDET